MAGVLWVDFYFDFFGFDRFVIYVVRCSIFCGARTGWVVDVNVVFWYLRSSSWQQTGIYIHIYVGLAFEDWNNIYIHRIDG